MTSVQSLPPKMAQQFADKARAGKADRQIGEGPGACYEFDNGSNVVILLSLDPPIGHIKRRNQI
jgi:hypothetical protein